MQTLRRDEIWSKVKTSWEKKRKKAKPVDLGSQGAWLRWETEQRTLKWSDIWQYPQLQLQFLLRSVYATPANLNRWNLPETPDCSGSREILRHIITANLITQTQGRYTRIHNQVLRKLADIERPMKDAETCKQKPVLYLSLGKAKELIDLGNFRPEPRLAVGCRFWAEAQVRRRSSNQPQAWYGALVNMDEVDHSHGVDSSMGRKMRGGKWKKKSEIWGTHIRV